MYSELAKGIITTTNKSSRLGQKICKITPHHCAGSGNADEIIRNNFCGKREASANYVIGTNGECWCNVEEESRAWTSSSANNDRQAITVEVANSTMSPKWEISKESMTTLILLMADICHRYGITPKYDGTEKGTITLHEMFANTNCPGPYIKENLDYIIQRVNAHLSAVSFVDAELGEELNSFGIHYRAYCQTGALREKIARNGQVAGNTTQDKRLEGLHIDIRKFQEIVPDAKLNVELHIQGIGWVRYANVTHDMYLGTKEQERRIEAVRIELIDAPDYDICCQLYIHGIGWTDPIKGPYANGSTGRASAIEAIRIWIVKREDNAMDC